MVSSEIANSIFQREMLDGDKTPHSTSYPVIYNENNKYYLAVFIFFHNRKDIEAGEIKRPSRWAIADIETGEIIKEYETKEKDFSDAPYDVKYNICSNAQYDTSKQYYEDAFSILDSVRSRIIRNGRFCKGEYQYYLNKILANIPIEYQRFYTDLSV